jgi:hypothetical protein
MAMPDEVEIAESTTRRAAVVAPVPVTVKKIVAAGKPGVKTTKVVGRKDAGKTAAAMAPRTSIPQSTPQMEKNAGFGWGKQKLKLIEVDTIRRKPSEKTTTMAEVTGAGRTNRRKKKSRQLETGIGPRTQSSTVYSLMAEVLPWLDGKHLKLATSRAVSTVGLATARRPVDHSAINRAAELIAKSVPPAPK